MSSNLVLKVGKVLLFIAIFEREGKLGAVLRMKILSVKKSYFVVLFLMCISVVLSFSLENIAYSQLSQGLVMSFFLTLLVLTRKWRDILGDRGEMIALGFMAISTVAVSTKASIELFDTIIWGALICFIGVVACSVLVDTNQNHAEQAVCLP